jgi:hypothetical protein
MENHFPSLEHLPVGRQERITACPEQTKWSEWTCPEQTYCGELVPRSPAVCASLNYRAKVDGLARHNAEALGVLAMRNSQCDTSKMMPLLRRYGSRLRRAFFVLHCVAS